MVRAKRRGNLFDPTCATRTILEVVADKWSAIVILMLDERPLRFNELGRVVKGISYKMLTQTLRRLERDGFVTRTVGTTRPLSVTYALATLGRDVVSVIDVLQDWSETHVASVLSARKIFDQQLAEESKLRR